MLFSFQMDSVCGDLLIAVNKFKDAFGGEDGSSLPHALASETESIANGAKIASADPDRLPPVTAKLLNSLESVVSGIRGLAGFLSSIKDVDRPEQGKFSSRNYFLNCKYLY